MVFHVHEFCVISQIYGILWPKETTEIDARDVLTEQTLLEYVCTSELIDRGCSGCCCSTCHVLVTYYRCCCYDCYSSCCCSLHHFHHNSNNNNNNGSTRTRTRKHQQKTTASTLLLHCESSCCYLHSQFVMATGRPVIPETWAWRSFATVAEPTSPPRPTRTEAQARNLNFEWELQLIRGVLIQCLV